MKRRETELNVFALRVSAATTKSSGSTPCFAPLIMLTKSECSVSLFFSQNPSPR